MQDSETELKPCPFCGGGGFLTEDAVSEYPDDGKIWHACCLDSCAVAPGVYAQQSRDDAIRKWNTRATKTQIELLCDEHRKAFSVFHAGGCLKCWQENQSRVSASPAAPVVDHGRIAAEIGRYIVLGGLSEAATADVAGELQRLLATAASTASTQNYYEQALTVNWEATNARRHELIAKKPSGLTEDEANDLRELQWLAGIKRELGSGPLPAFLEAPSSQPAQEAAREIAHQINGGDRAEGSYPPALAELLEDCSIVDEEKLAQWLESIISRYFPEP